MRIAAISDVHGNLHALDAVLAHLAKQDVDVAVNLGDVLSGGLQPAETADRLMAIGLPTIRGNHERQVLTMPDDRLRASDRFARETMEPHHVAWFESLPSMLLLADDVLACHGSPGDDATYLLETVEPSGARRATEEEVRARLDGHLKWSLLLCGHTHLQRAMHVAGGPLVVNPGSVGWPAYADDDPYPHAMEAGTPHARYAIVDDATGSWRVEFHAVEYDWHAAAALAEKNGRPDIARSLLTGRVRD